MTSAGQAELEPPCRCRVSRRRPGPHNRPRTARSDAAFCSSLRKAWSSMYTPLFDAGIPSFTIASARSAAAAAVSCAHSGLRHTNKPTARRQEAVGVLCHTWIRRNATHSTEEGLLAAVVSATCASAPAGVSSSSPRSDAGAWQRNTAGVTVNLAAHAHLGWQHYQRTPSDMGNGRRPCQGPAASSARECACVTTVTGHESWRPGPRLGPLPATCGEGTRWRGGAQKESRTWPGDNCTTAAPTAQLRMTAGVHKCTSTSPYIAPRRQYAGRPQHPIRCKYL